ncbi:MAG: hypothetical protein Q8Q09_18365 [Deltaproteobacteria bacterium]|nr:hypothetical protein [Deltaproteobacteria bacterium]
MSVDLPRLSNQNPRRSRVSIALMLFGFALFLGFGGLVLSALRDAWASPIEPRPITVAQLQGWRETRETQSVRVVDMVVPCEISPQIDGGSHYRLATDRSRSVWFVLTHSKTIACNDDVHARWGWRYLIRPKTRDRWQFAERPWREWPSEDVTILVLERSPHSEARAALALSPIALIGLAIGCLFALNLRRRRRRGVLIPGTKLPERDVLPRRRIFVNPADALRALPGVMLSSAATLFLCLLGVWSAVDSPGGMHLATIAIGVFIGLIGVGAGTIAAVLLRNWLRMLRPLGLNRVERWMPITNYGVAAERDFEVERHAYYIEHPARDGTFELRVDPFECTPWLVAGHVLCVYDPAVAEVVHVVRRDGAPLRLTPAEISAINKTLWPED